MLKVYMPFEYRQRYGKPDLLPRNACSDFDMRASQPRALQETLCMQFQRPRDNQELFALLLHLLTQLLGQLDPVSIDTLLSVLI